MLSVTEGGGTRGEASVSPQRCQEAGAGGLAEDGMKSDSMCLLNA